MYTEEIGGRIRERREKLGLKQTDLANALQVSAQAVSKWERGENAPDISVIVPLAGLLGVSTDWLLGYHREKQDIVEATVLVSDVRGVTKRSGKLSVKEFADWINGFQFQVTEAVLQHGGIPVKYVGDGLLAFFSGAEHEKRALDASRQARRVMTDDIAIGLSSGDIYLGTIGHPDYASRDILGDAVNLAFRVAVWAGRNTESKVAASASVIDGAETPGEIGAPEPVELKGMEEPVTIFEVKTDTSS
jgi:class 3 adenylate cyclase